MLINAMRGTLYILPLPLVTSRELFVMATHSKCGPVHPFYDYVKIYLRRSSRDYNILLIQKLCTHEKFTICFWIKKNRHVKANECVCGHARARSLAVARVFEFLRVWLQPSVQNVPMLLAAADIVCIASRSHRWQRERFHRHKLNV